MIWKNEPPKLPIKDGKHYWWARKRLPEHVRVAHPDMGEYARPHLVCLYGSKKLHIYDGTLGEIPDTFAQWAGPIKEPK